MKIQFDPNLDFQKQAIESVAGVFEGQEICQTNFTVAPLQYTTHQVIPGMENNLGIGNRLKLLPEDIHKNIRKIQLQNGLAPSEKMDSMDFTVEMETGTGKTHVYLRSIFEMNRLYGFTKFIIVVPSIAIKEGVAKSPAKAEIDLGGVHAEQVQETASVYESRSFDLPDLITYLQNETNLMRRTIVKIINDSGRLESFKNNPQKFIEQVSTIIQHQMRLFVVDGIKYHKLSSTIKEESLFKIIAYGNVPIKKD